MTALLRNSGQRLDDVIQTHLVLASGKLVLQKKYVRILKPDKSKEIICKRLEKQCIIIFIAEEMVNSKNNCPEIKCDHDLNFIGIVCVIQDKVTIFLQILSQALVFGIPEG